MTEAELQLSLIYMGAFRNPAEWTQPEHLDGLKRVWAAGATTRQKIDALQASADTGDAS